jgi:phosphatidylglycerophosphatase A
LDEGAGIFLTALFVPIYPGWRELWALLAIFLAFRVFDIVKLAPAKQLEKLPYGWGILLDDLAAAVYANIICQVLLRWTLGSGNNFI